MPLSSTNLSCCLPVSGNYVAFIDTGVTPTHASYTASELTVLVDCFANKLKTMGVKTGERIGILGHNGADYLVCYLGIMRMGAVAVPINFKLSTDTIRFILDDSECKMCFVSGTFEALITDHIETAPLSGVAANAGPHQTCLADLFEPSDHDLAEILYTSGSTGRPKGVPLTHHGQSWALNVSNIENVRSGDTTIVAAPFYHMNALFFTALALKSGISVVSMPTFDADTYLDLVARYNCTLLSGVPTMFALAGRSKNAENPERFSSVKQISLGSSPLTEALIDDVRALFPKAAISNGYGTTEAGPSIFGHHPEGIEKPVLSIGYPREDIEWCFLEGGTTEGTLIVKTPALAAGYLNRPDATAAKFREGWYNTEDVMRRDADGFFYFVGRADDMFVCGGENIYPGEVEKLIEQHPGVSQSAIVAVPDAIKGAVPVAFVVRNLTSASVSEQDIKAHCLKNGPAYAHPRHVLFRENLPLGGTNKVDRKALETIARNFRENHLKNTNAGGTASKPVAP